MRSVLAEARFLGIIRAELRAEVLAIRGAPKFNSSVVRSERRVAVGATAGAVVDVSAARDHRIPPASRDVTHGRSNESLPADSSSLKKMKKRGCKRPVAQNSAAVVIGHRNCVVFVTVHVF